MKVKLNIQAIRTAEKMLSKPFNKFDLTDEHTVKMLMYGMVSENNENTFTYKEFERVFEMEQMQKQIVSKFNDEMEYLRQFPKTEESAEPDTEAYMGDLAAYLIQSGMDAEFVLYKMKLFEIPDYVKAIDDLKKEQMEQERFWTYLNILPHVDGKKLTAPTKLVAFPWEAAEIARNKESEVQKADAMFEKFINSKPIEL